MTPAAKGRERIAVVGAGPVGVHFVCELLSLSSKVDVHLFGDEQHAPYNRVGLSELLSGDKTLDQLHLELPDSPHLTTYFGTRVAFIGDDMLVTEQGEMLMFNKIVLAVGSKAHIPHIPNLDVEGTFVLRTLKDAEQLISRQIASRHTVVLGGGLLGIEAAKAMRRFSTKVTLIHHSPWLMNHQLDEVGASFLKRELTDQGIDVRLRSSIQQIVGEGRLEAVRLRDQQTLDCDTLIIATGITPNLELAKEAGIAVGRGIKIDETLKTSARNIYAIGECAEFNDEVIGLLAPGLEQASLLARQFTQKEQATYKRTSQVIQLKVLGKQIASIGEMGNISKPQQVVSYRDEQGLGYRVIQLKHNRISGAAAIGPWDQIYEVKEAVEQQKKLSFWQLRRFKKTGFLFPQSQGIQDHHVICNCKQVTAGELRACAASGKALDSTGAGSVCGSCVPLLAQFEDASKPVPKQHDLPIVGIALLSLSALLSFVLLAPFSLSAYYDPSHISHWWLSSDNKQISGFSILGLTVLGFLFSLRKRLNFLKILSFKKLRFVHAGLSLLCLVILFLHTGLADFQGLNAWLLYTFLGVCVFGAVTSVMADLEMRQVNVTTKAIKRFSVLAHVISFWPMPVLLGFHILSVYWF